MIYTGFELILRKDDPEVTIKITLAGVPIDPANIHCIYRSDKRSCWTRMWYWLTRQHLRKRDMRYQFVEPLDALASSPILTLSSEEAGRPFCLYSLKWQKRVPLWRYTEASISEED